MQTISRRYLRRNLTTVLDAVEQHGTRFSVTTYGHRRSLVICRDPQREWPVGTDAPTEARVEASAESGSGGDPMQPSEPLYQSFDLTVTAAPVRSHFCASVLLEVITAAAEDKGLAVVLALSKARNKLQTAVDRVVLDLYGGGRQDGHDD